MTFQDRDQPSSRVCVGKIAMAHGVKGLVKVLPFVEDTKLLENVFTSENGAQTLRLTIKNPLGKYVLAEVEGITDRNGAEALGKCSLYVPRESMPEPDEGEVYIDDLIGLPALDAEGSEIGSVLSVQNYGASDLLEIRLKNGKSVLVPLTPDFVPDIGDTVTVLNYEAFL